MHDRCSNANVNPCNGSAAAITMMLELSANNPQRTKDARPRRSATGNGRVGSTTASPAIPPADAIPRRLDRRWYCVEISHSGRAPGARAAHAPGPTAGTRKASAPPGRSRPWARADGVYAEALRATSAPTGPLGPPGSASGQAKLPDLLQRPRVLMWILSISGPSIIPKLLCEQDQRG
jgi:hypothetical protein